MLHAIRKTILGVCVRAVVVASMAAGAGCGGSSSPADGGSGGHAGTGGEGGGAGAKGLGGSGAPGTGGSGAAGTGGAGAGGAGAGSGGAGGQSGAAGSGGATGRGGAGGQSGTGGNGAAGSAGRGGAGAAGGSGGIGGSAAGTGGRGGNAGVAGGAGAGGGAGTGGNAGGGGTAACSPSEVGTCSGGLSCLDCPSGPTMVQYLCTTACTGDGQCNDPARPMCNLPPGGGGGICTSSTFACAWQSKCAAPTTRIATPSGPRAISTLAVGDLVYSLDQGGVVAVPILRVTRIPVSGHHVARVTLNDGAVLEISEGHPTADGRLFRDLGPGDRLGTKAVAGVESVPYRFAFTFDILPASDSGTYFAEGALIGSTLASTITKTRASDRLSSFSEGAGPSVRPVAHP
jgi:hypothetical protein